MYGNLCTGICFSYAACEQSTNVTFLHFSRFFFLNVAERSPLRRWKEDVRINENNDLILIKARNSILTIAYAIYKSWVVIDSSKVN